MQLVFKTFIKKTAFPFLPTGKKETPRPRSIQFLFILCRNSQRFANSDVISSQVMFFSAIKTIM